jgi:hypothetical protein
MLLICLESFFVTCITLLGLLLLLLLLLLQLLILLPEIGSIAGHTTENSYYYYYYLTAIGLTPGGSSINLYTNSTQNAEDGTYITITRRNLGSKLGSAGRTPSLRVLLWHLP